MNLHPGVRLPKMPGLSRGSLLILVLSTFWHCSTRFGGALRSTWSAALSAVTRPGSTPLLGAAVCAWFVAAGALAQSQPPSAPAGTELGPQPSIGSALKTELAAATSPEEQGQLVALAADIHDSGYVDLTVDLEMLLRAADGRSTQRELSIRQLEVPSDGDKLLVVFSTPKSVKGTALLSYSHKQGQDDQWLYLPAIKRVKKITSKNRSGPFLSSEFAFEDLTPQEVDKYRYELLRTAPCKAGACYVLQRIAKDEHTGYSRQEQWLDDKHLLTQKIDYFDRRGDLLKTLEVADYQLFNELHWRALNLVMNNHRTGKSTELRWKNYRFATGLDADRDFSANSLRRVR